MKTNIRIPLYINDYIASTMHLSAEGRGSNRIGLRGFFCQR